MLDELKVELIFNTSTIVSDVNLNWKYVVYDSSGEETYLFSGSDYGDFEEETVTTKYIYEPENKNGLLYINTVLKSTDITKNDGQFIDNELAITVSMPAYDSSGNLNHGFYQIENNILFNPLFAIDNSLNSLGVSDQFTSLSHINTEKWLVKINLVSVKDSLLNHVFSDYVDVIADYFNIVEPGLYESICPVYFPWYLFPSMSSYINFCNAYNGK